jgi:hypothetical protein
MHRLARRVERYRSAGRMCLAETALRQRKSSRRNAAKLTAAAFWRAAPEVGLGAGRLGGGFLFRDVRCAFALSCCALPSLIKSPRPKNVPMTSLPLPLTSALHVFQDSLDGFGRATIHVDHSSPFLTTGRFRFPCRPIDETALVTCRWRKPGGASNGGPLAARDSAPTCGNPLLRGPPGRCDGGCGMRYR